MGMRMGLELLDELELDPLVGGGGGGGGGGDGLLLPEEDEPAA